MDWLMMKDRLTDGFKKYRYAILVLVIGIALMLIPNQEKKTQNVSAEEESKTQQIEQLDERLSDILSKIKGAGNVEVMLTVKSGEEILYQTDQRMQSGNGGTDQWDTVIITDENRNESGLIKQVLPPIYQGAIVICEGADKAAVRLAIVEAVSKVTGLGADQISVLKMK